MEISGYTIESKIAKGGMATVYLATQESLHRPVVLKILDIDGFIITPEHIKRFLTEGRIIANFNHPNIVTVYDIGTIGDSFYISMEYIQDGDLETRMELPINPKVALNYLGKIASGLDVAHKKGIVHRDIKPANILFKDDEPLISDFGIAKEMGEIDKDSTLSGMFLGTPTYVSPEQIECTEIDGRTDIYSLGCVFYEMLTGDKPYVGDNVSTILYQHKNSPVPVFEPELQMFQPLLDKMMAKDRAQRFRSIGEMLDDVHQLQQHFTTEDQHLERSPDKQSNVILNILLFLLMISGGVLGVLQYAVSTINNASSAQLDRIPVPSNDAQYLLPDSNDSQSTTNKEVMQALRWLGQHSLKEYRLTTPEMDNAYYYFSRLLAMDPNDKDALEGIANIADRYAMLAEYAIRHNQPKKAEAYINAGLKFNSQHKEIMQYEALLKDMEDNK